MAGIYEYAGISALPKPGRLSPWAIRSGRTAATPLGADAAPAGHALCSARPTTTPYVPPACRAGDAGRARDPGHPTTGTRAASKP